MSNNVIIVSRDPGLQQRLFGIVQDFMGLQAMYFSQVNDALRYIRSESEADSYPSFIIFEAGEKCVEGLALLEALPIPGTYTIAVASKLGGPFTLTEEQLFERRVNAIVLPSVQMAELHEIMRSFREQPMSYDE